MKDSQPDGIANRAKQLMSRFIHIRMIGYDSTSWIAFACCFFRIVHGREGTTMKRLGIIGGIGPESTIIYYRAIMAAGRDYLGGAPPILLNSIDVQRVLRLAEDDPVPGLRDYLVSEITLLAQAGVSVGLIAANTPHIVFDDVRRQSPIELVSIVEAAKDAARGRGLTRLALFGTKFTMQGRFYPDVFVPSGIELVCPAPDEQAFIHDSYVGELLRNIFLPTTRERLQRIIQAMKDRDGIDGVLLAGTELPLLLTGDNACDLPLLDTTQIHVAAAVRRTWG
jgi:aspartate racemase